MDVWKGFKYVHDYRCNFSSIALNFTWTSWIILDTEIELCNINFHFSLYIIYIPKKMFVAIRGKGKHSQFRAIYEAFMRENMISNLQVSTWNMVQRCFEAITGFSEKINSDFYYLRFCTPLISAGLCSFCALYSCIIYVTTLASYKFYV